MEEMGKMVRNIYNYSLTAMTSMHWSHVGWPWEQKVLGPRHNLRLVALLLWLTFPYKNPCIGRPPVHCSAPYKTFLLLIYAPQPSKLGQVLILSFCKSDNFKYVETTK